MTFIDLTKASDTVRLAGLWKIMAKFDSPEKLIAMVQQFHGGMLARIVIDGESSEPFPVTSAVKQGRVLPSTLYSRMFSAMLTDAFCDCDTGIDISYQTDDNLFNLWRLEMKMKSQEVTVHDLLFADDGSLNDKSESDMQQSMDHFSSTCDNFALTIITKKMSQQGPAEGP
ncbi:hypothetical protein Y1Q_0001015 [Alligator mississippiensis]|uniref:Reverse transcriptase domain-containing protein n=1 Tax=Alligator mississippiensis TaxID=8496 RepID=A0A151NE86_ALLMI|nr:hypothetical protein Y1Q_0001015 [Alligator mississippiensis]